MSNNRLQGWIRLEDQCNHTINEFGPHPTEIFPRNVPHGTSVRLEEFLEFALEGLGRGGVQ